MSRFDFSILIFHFPVHLPAFLLLYSNGYLSSGLLELFLVVFLVANQIRFEPIIPMYSLENFDLLFENFIWCITEHRYYISKHLFALHGALFDCVVNILVGISTFIVFCKIR